MPLAAPSHRTWDKDLLHFTAGVDVKVFRASGFSATLIAVSVTLSGCAARFDRPRLPDVFIDPSPAEGPNGTYTLSDFQKDFQDYRYATAGSSPNETAAQAARNKMVYGVMAEIDFVYHDYEIALFMDQNNFKVATDVLQLGLGMATTITNGERAKTVISAVLTGVTGTTLSIDKNFFRQQTVQALVSSMQAGRDEIKTSILKQLSESSTSYPFQAARSDLAAYFYAGTLPAALQHLSQTAATNAIAQRKVLTGVSEQDVTDATKLRHGVAQAIANHHLENVVQLLKDNDVDVAASNPDAIEAAFRDLLNRMVDAPPEQRKAFMDRAKELGLIQ